MEAVKSVKKYTIKQIFKDHWPAYLAKYLDTPEYIVDEVEKMLACRDPNKLGYHKYVCPKHPNEYIVAPHSCKSRVCSVCGANLTNKWMQEAMVDFPDCGYFHLVFTIPDYLWYWFRFQSKRPLLGILFTSAKETVLGWFLNRDIIPAAISVMHTFGKKLNFNTHIHMIVSAGGLKKIKPRKNKSRVKKKKKVKNKTEKSAGSYVWKDVPKLPWNVFRHRWKAIFLRKLNKYLHDSLKNTVSKPAWYIYISKVVDNPVITCQYIGRYSKRPPMAETRITSYDGKFVSFYYEDRQENSWKKKKYITLTAEEFINRLIQHIPLPQFKMIRHYGILANAAKHELLPIAFKLLGQTTKKTAWWRPWRMRQKDYLNRDPMLCKVCGREMVLSELAFWSKRNNRLYVKHMSMELEYDIQTKGAVFPKCVFWRFFTIFR